MSSGGAGTSESAASAGCSLSERDRRGSSTGHHRSGIHQSNRDGQRQQLATHASVANSLDASLEGRLAVFTWGRGEDGQLGLGDTSDQDEPTYVDALRGVGVRQIACGSGHTVVLSTEGEVFTWGRGDDGRLGHGDNGWKYVPRITRSLAGRKFFTNVQLGPFVDGCLLTFFSFFAVSVFIERFDIPEVVTQVTCGSYHTAAVTGNGDLYTW